MPKSKATISLLYFPLCTPAGCQGCQGIPLLTSWVDGPNITAPLRGAPEDRDHRVTGLPCQANIKHMHASRDHPHRVAKDVPQKLPKHPPCPPCMKHLLPWQLLGTKTLTGRRHRGSGWGPQQRLSGRSKFLPLASGDIMSHKAPQLSGHGTFLAAWQGHPVPLGVMALLRK